MLFLEVQNEKSAPPSPPSTNIRIHSFLFLIIALLFFPLMTVLSACMSGSSEEVGETTNGISLKLVKGSASARSARAVVGNGNLVVEMKGTGYSDKVEVAITENSRSVTVHNVPVGIVVSFKATFTEVTGAMFGGEVSQVIKKSDNVITIPLNRIVPPPAANGSYSNIGITLRVYPRENLGENDIVTYHVKITAGGKTFTKDLQYSGNEGQVAGTRQAAFGSTMFTESGTSNSESYTTIFGMGIVNIAASCTVVYGDGSPTTQSSWKTLSQE